MAALATEAAPFRIVETAPEQQLLALARQAVLTGESSEIVSILKEGLAEMAMAGSFDRFPFPPAQAAKYSRRLVYSDAWERFTIIAMTWGPGQCTPLHDHCGVWCVEVVTHGHMEVIPYELLEEDPYGRCRFERRGTVPAPPASAGGLIPPFEHHVFSNAGQSPSHTLHIYGGPMNRCDIFQPVAEGVWQRQHRDLCYDM